MGRISEGAARPAVLPSWRTRMLWSRHPQPQPLVGVHIVHTYCTGNPRLVDYDWRRWRGRSVSVHRGGELRPCRPVRHGVLNRHAWCPLHTSWRVPRALTRTVGSPALEGHTFGRAEEGQWVAVGSPLLPLGVGWGRGEYSEGQRGGQRVGVVCAIPGQLAGRHYGRPRPQPPRAGAHGACTRGGMACWECEAGRRPRMREEREEDSLATRHRRGGLRAERGRARSNRQKRMQKTREKKKKRQEHKIGRSWRQVATPPPEISKPPHDDHGLGGGVASGNSGGRSHASRPADTARVQWSNGRNTPRGALDKTGGHRAVRGPTPAAALPATRAALTNKRIPPPPRGVGCPGLCLSTRCWIGRCAVASASRWLSVVRGEEVGGGGGQNERASACNPPPPPFRPPACTPCSNVDVDILAQTTWRPCGAVRGSTRFGVGRGSSKRRWKRQWPLSWPWLFPWQRRGEKEGHLPVEVTRPRGRPKCPRLNVNCCAGERNGQRRRLGPYGVWMV